MNVPAPEDDDRNWQDWAAQWSIRSDTTYLNHGSFGPPSLAVRHARRDWLDRLDQQPMDVLVRQREDALRASLARLAGFVRTAADNLVLVENATFAMNTVASSFSFAPGDEVLLTDHEYGAVRRIWDRAGRRAGATVRTAELPFPPEDPQRVVDAITSAITDRTKLVVCSHVTSPTALHLPASDICRACRQREIAVCIDGPHAVGQLPLELDRLDCDFYTASCHKWLSGPLGSGFLYVHPRRQAAIEPLNLSWGRLEPDAPVSWQDEFLWTGTRDNAALAALPPAIDLVDSIGVEALSGRGHFLASYGAELIDQWSGYPPLADHRRWYGMMVCAELPPGEPLPLRNALWQRYRIEVPIIQFAGRRFVRISCHLYNTRRHVEYLSQALRELVG
jgi:isopenicillin-N epimerase